VTPWKYGFKGCKSIVKIELLREQPKTTWNEAAPREYGFYANVNPEVDHPRWSQASERRIGEFSRRDTLAVQRLPEFVAELSRASTPRRSTDQRRLEDARRLGAPASKICLHCKHGSWVARGWRRNSH